MTLSDTLYLSDLDGTLLTPEITLSARSSALIGDFIARGGKFSISTARTPASVFQILGGLPLHHPISMMNGVLIYDPASRRYLQTVDFGLESAQVILAILREAAVDPVVFFLESDTLYPTYHTMSPLLLEYAREREVKYGKRFYPVDSLEREIARNNGALYFCAREREETFTPLLPLLRALPGVHVECYKDIYAPGAAYLEVFSDRASKENSTHALRSLTGVRQVVSFGDNLNDLPMFRASDASYAVANAVEAVRAAATATIGPNTADGVAEFLNQIR
ncbi:MAG: HAD-IIB family hydrolase [Clostridia bacterium]|nr:HAD-IIB family hydrolase [Clostridia bacterium]